jgi:putative membrane protein
MRALVDASALSAEAAGWSHMGGWGWGMAISCWLFMMLLVSLVGWLIWSATRRPESSNDDRRGAVDFLDERYARGEIEREEYLQRKNDLEK